MAFNQQILRNSTLEIQTALGSNLTITGITSANPAVVTCTQSLSNGDLVVLSGIVGMKRMNDRVVRVASVSGTTFACEGLDTSNTTIYGSYTSGGIANEVTTLSAFDSVTAVNIPDGGPDEIDITAISDSTRQIVYGHDAVIKGTIDLYSDPNATPIAEVLLASDLRTARVFRLTTASGYVHIFNATNISGGGGFAASSGQAATGQISVTLPYRIQAFSS